MILADKIQKLRKERGLSQEQLAAELNISRQSVSKWELGTTAPELDKLRTLSEYFQVSADYLIHDEWDEDQTIARGPIDAERTARDKLRLDFQKRLFRVFLRFAIPWLTLQLISFFHDLFYSLFGRYVGSFAYSIPLQNFVDLAWALAIYLLPLGFLVTAGMMLWHHLNDPLNK